MPVRLPAEWEPHAATWLAWPHVESCWPDALDAAQAELLELARALAPSETVHLLVPDAATAGRVRARLEPLEVVPHVAAVREVWLRDTGPTFAHGDAGLLAVDWGFDGWGGRFPAADADRGAAGLVTGLAGAEPVRADLALEGGALDGDGDGTLLVAEACLLDPARNPGRSRGALERRLCELLGARVAIGLPGALSGDDTGGHVDNLARFVAPGRVACVRPSDPADPDRALLDECRARLAVAHDARGRRLDVVDLPSPPPLLSDGRRLAASYANFYVANRAVLVPAFGEASDALARGVLQALLPDRPVRSVSVRTLLRDGGGCHCLTLPQPAPGNGPGT